MGSKRLLTRVLFFVVLFAAPVGSGLAQEAATTQAVTTQPTSRPTTQQAVEQAAEAAAEKAAEKITEKVAEKAAEKVAEKAAEKAVEKAAEAKVAKEKLTSKRPDAWFGPTEVKFFIFIGDIDEIADADQNFMANVFLGLKADQMKFNITYGGVAENDSEISVLTRSIIHVLIDLSSHAEVPAEDIAQGRARPDAPIAEGSEYLVRVRNSPEKPTDVYTSVRYCDTWYWVDNKDLKSKGVMTFLVMLFAIMESGSQHAAPLVTVPAG
jgi:hypothetical protein